MFWRKQKKLPTRAPAKRHRDIFPSGFDSSQSSSSERYYPSSPERLYNSLVDAYIPERHVEHIIVRGAWYGKEKKSAQHEFILIEIEDTAVAGLVNYMILDRANAEPAQVCPGVVAFSRPDAKASDAFKVSFEGDRDKLFRECGISSYWLLEELRFPPEEPLHLFELVSIARFVSLNHPTYHPLLSNCYLFAGLIWECMRKLKSEALYLCAPGFETERGRFGRLRYQATPADIDNISQQAEEDIENIIEELEKHTGTLGPKDTETQAESTEI